MLDLKLIREEPEIVKQGLARKGIKPEVVGRLFELDSQRRPLIQEVDLLKASRNRANDEISKAKKEGKPANTLIDGMKSISP